MKSWQPIVAWLIMLQAKQVVKDVWPFLSNPGNQVFDNSFPIFFLDILNVAIGK
jgi:hypothetical protein